MRKILFCLVLFIGSYNALFAQAHNFNAPIVLAYFPSYSENWVTAGQNSRMREIPSFVNYVFLAFAKPNLTYVKGSYDVSKAKTGIEVPYDGCALKESVSALKAKGINVILSIGGETYWQDSNAYNINYQQIKDLVDDIGFAGIDWDFEPNGTFEFIGNATNVQYFKDFITNSRALMPRSQGYIIACAPSGVGALGGSVNDDATSPFKFANRNTLTGETDTNLYQGTAVTNGINLFGFSTTGHMIPVFQAVGDKIDMVAYQGYNVGGSANRSIMYDAYAYYAEKYGFKVAAGVHVPNEPWGPYYTFSHQKVADLASHVKNYASRVGDNDGIMLWELLKTSPATSTSGYSFMNVSNKVLNGTPVATAVADANTYSLAPYTGGATGCTTVIGTTYCGASEYNSTQSYPTANTQIFYQCKIWKNKWWANPGELPGSNTVWEFVKNCTEGPGCNLSVHNYEIEQSLKAYVNEGNIVIKLENNLTPIESVQLFNIQGQKVIEQHVNQNNCIINMKAMAEGIYIAKCRIDDYDYNLKIIVQKF